MDSVSSQVPRASSTEDLDPFRDPQSCNNSFISLEASSSSGRVDTPLSSTPRPVQFQAPKSPPRHTQTSLTDDDAILPIAPIRPLPNLRSLQSSQHDEGTTYNLSTRRPLPPPLDNSPAKLRCGRRAILATKWIFISLLISANALFIFATWYWPHEYYVFLPFITITVALNCIMVFSIILHKLFHWIWPEKEIIPEEPESMVLLLPCYNETPEEIRKSLDSLVEQTGISRHKTAIMIVVDGRVRGPGMKKTTADSLMDDILSDKNSRQALVNAYNSWDHTEMDVTIQQGTYGDIPYICIVKEKNRGKRDSLILVRSFLYNFNIRDTRPAVIQSPYFFGTLVSFLTGAAGFSKCDLLIGMDGDTYFEPTCISELLKESHYKHTIGVCGFVAVDFKDRWLSPWSLYQSTEYAISQCLRRLHQSLATHKVSCLPGCCQLLKVCESTCGDHILLDLFGYHPCATDNLLKQIRATASEDRNHVCLMLSTFPKAQTRQAIRARAYTDVPHSWTIFLSQRRRWTLGATVNDLYLVLAPGVLLFERILAFANVSTWFLNLFIIGCIASFIKACTFVSYKLILAFASVMILPLVWYILIVVWQPRGFKERIQYLLGLCIYVSFGPFLNLFVLTYALWSIDNFAWGKTRQVVEDKEVKQVERVSEKLAPLSPKESKGEMV